MPPELLVVWIAIQSTCARLRRVHAEPDTGYSTEAVVVTALLVALGIAAVAIIASKVLAKAGSIQTGS